MKPVYPARGFYAMSTKVISTAFFSALTLWGCVGEEPLVAASGKSARDMTQVNPDSNSKEQKGQAATSNQKPKAPAKSAISATKLDPGPQLQDPALGEPRLGLALNGLKHATVRAGSSVLIESFVRAGDGDEGSVSATLSSSGGTWAELVVLDLRDTKGNTVAGLSFRRLLQAETSISIDEENAGRLAWELDLSAKVIAPGEYRLQALLDSSRSNSGWKGKVRSHVSRLTVKPATAEVALDDLRSEIAARVQILAFGGKDADAVGACDEFLAKYPQDVVILEGKGDALFRLKKFQDAYQAYEKAISFVKSKHAPNTITEPPNMLIHKSNLALAELQKLSK